MEIKKQYLKSNSDCKVTFKLPKEVVLDAQKVTICGDFNNWNQEEHEMKILKSGEASITLTLNIGKSYQYKYVIDGSRWENDPYAESLISNEFGENNSVVTI